MTCILDGFKRNGCGSCPPTCQHAVAMNGLNGRGGRVGASGIPDAYRHLTLANSPAREGQRAIYESLERYASTFGRGEAIKSVYLWSETPGNGKTSTAAALANEFIARHYLTALKNGEQPAQVPAVFLDVNEFQSEYNLATMTKDDAAMERIGESIRRVQRAPFAVLDDIGVREATQAFRSYMHAIINHRVANGLPSVFTSNIPPEGLEKVFDARLYDRIREQCGIIHFAGKSHRGRR